MLFDGFEDLIRSDAWSYFGISADYKNGQVSIYIKVFDGISLPLSKTFSVEYPGFLLRNNA